MRKRLAVVAGCMLLSCASSGFAAKVHLTHYYWIAAGSPVLDLLKDRAKAFEKEHPNVQVDIVSNNDWDKIIVSMAAGKPPDVFDGYVGGSAKFIQAGLLTDLTPYVKRDRIPMDQYLDTVMNAFRYNGTLFGFPWGYGTVGVIYNTKLVSEAGLPDINALQASGGWDWAALTEFGKKLTRDVNKDGKIDFWGIGSSLQTGRYPMWAQQAGEPLFDSFINPTKSHFQGAAAREGLRYFTDLYTNLNIATGDWMGIQKGTVAVSVDSFAGTHTTIYAAVGDKVPIDAAVVPRGPKNGGSMFSANAFYIPKGSKNKDLAWEWVKFLLLGRDNQLRWMSASGKPSPMKGMEDEYKSRPHFPPHVDAYVKMAMDPATTPIYDSSLKDFNVVGDDVIARVISGKEQFNQWLATSDKRFDQLFARQKKR